MANHLKRSNKKEEKEEEKIDKDLILISWFDRSTFLMDSTQVVLFFPILQAKSIQWTSENKRISLSGKNKSIVYCFYIHELCAPEHYDPHYNSH